jgi:spore germination protein
MDQTLYEEIGFILQVGLELDNNDNFVYSLTYPVTAEDAEEKIGFLSVKNKNLMRVSKEELRDQSGKKLFAGKAQHIFFSEGLAQKGISEFLEIFLRNPDNPIQANVVVVDGSPKEMMELSFGYKDKPSISFYVNDLLKDGRDKAIASELRLYSITILDHAKTIDPFIPILKYDSKGIEIKGSALLDGDRMVGEIDKEQTILLNLLTGAKKKGRYTLEKPVPNENILDIMQGAAIMILSAKRKLNINLIQGEKPLTDIKLEIMVRVEEYTGPDHLEDDEMKKQLETLLANSIKSDCVELLKILQKTGSDPIGLEEKIRAKNNEAWKSMNWEEKYREMQFQVDVKVNVESYGVIS